MAGFAQVAPATSLAFDVASVTESSSLEQDGLFRRDPERFTVTNLSLRWLIRYAFRLRDYQVLQAPGWADTRYFVQATFKASATDDEVRAMLRRLLEDRFVLRAHREKRTLQIYSLTKASADGALGPKLARSSTSIDCARPAGERVVQSPAGGGRPTPTCAMFETAWFIRGFTRTMPQLAQILDEIVGSPVVDRTDLAGSFDFDVQWGKAGDTPVDPSHQTTEGLASLFTALREQLGLKLEPMRAPYEVLVVDSVQRPTPD